MDGKTLGRKERERERETVTCQKDPKFVKRSFSKAKPSTSLTSFPS